MKTKYGQNGSYFIDRAGGVFVLHTKELMRRKNK
jgi:hypothetical protein